MKYPIAKIKRDREVGKKVKSVNRYLMYDTETKELSIMGDKDLADSSDKIVGFNFGTNGPNPTRYFSNLGFIGEEQTDDIKCYTIIKQIYYTHDRSFELVDREGKPTSVDREQLIELIKQGNKIAGAVLVFKNANYKKLLDKGVSEEEARLKAETLLVSNDIECEHASNLKKQDKDK